MTPNPEIQAYIDDLNVQIAPIMSTVIGDAAKYIPRPGCLWTRGWALVRIADRERYHGCIETDLQY